ncbi:hypothetical protein GSS87_00860 [Corynebacterium sp. 4HC-13]|uniref:Uncharacterized protein n=1 Tax=Corynebacterium anserum TaxID=2684406 RepID=A0A7G7YMA9_9CORY|nr:hypothetical protein [Corynebacterium anserum]QNH95629.1 hypothetical protein GP473_02070 [Corynebacterium anserum]
MDRLSRSLIDLYKAISCLTSQGISMKFSKKQRLFG